MTTFKLSMSLNTYWYTPTLMSRLAKEEDDSSEEEDSAEESGSALLELSVPEDKVTVSDEDDSSVADEVGSWMSLLPLEDVSLLEESSSVLEDEDS